MKAYIAFLPGMIAAWYAWFQSTEKAFLNVYIPALLLLPILYKIELSGLPDLGFAQSAILPIFFLYLLKHRFQPQLKVNLFDLLVIGYVLTSVYSEYVNSGLQETQQGGVMYITLLSSKVTTVLFPYFLAKWLIIPKNLSVSLAKKMIVLLIATLILCAYEWRFVMNAHITFFGWFFPNQEYWIPTWRYGLVRISGPFPHPILLGMAFGVVFLLNHWLVKNKFWDHIFVFSIPLSKGMIFTCILIFGLGLTISRAPIVSTAVAALFLGIGYSKQRMKSLSFRLIILMILAVIGLQFFHYYSSIDKRLASSQLATAATYRIELVDKYFPLIKKKPYWGWGIGNLPIKSGMKSIDNEYLWILLKHGFVTLSFFVGIILAALWKLFFRGISYKNKDPLDRSFSFTLFSIYFMLSLSFMTVWMGGQIEPLFFVLTGWTQGFLLTKPQEARVLLTSSKLVPA